VTSGLLWLGLVTVFTALVAGIAWVNSPKARARRPGQGAQLFITIFLSVAPWTIGIAAIKPLFDAVPHSGWVEFVIVALLLGGPLMMIEILFQPTRKLHAAYAEESDGQ
jgi:hypothetical protein